MTDITGSKYPFAGEPGVLRPGLPTLPDRMKSLRVDGRGFPVPWFVAWVNGEPDFRVVRERGILQAHHQRTCWLCGQPLGQYYAFVIGCMCAVNRINSEPPSHRECAEFAVKACPFLVNPRMRRNEKDLPPEARDPAGVMIKRNPGVSAMWVTKSYQPFETEGGCGFLFALGEPVEVTWWREGRPATLEECNTSIETGFPLLMDFAKREGSGAVLALREALVKCTRLLPAAT